ncbi:MAG: hypothetical protein HC842_09835 [Cytophagales bacterium]|nr:hypothetical protein [Cytophagales bacterium]
MKNQIQLICLLGLMALSAAAQPYRQSLPEWEDPRVTALNRMPMRATSISYENENKHWPPICASRAAFSP